MADVLERALDPRVAPRRIVRRHPHDELTDSRTSTPRRPDSLAYVHLRAINWRCHRSKVSGVAIVAIIARVTGLRKVSNSSSQAVQDTGNANPDLACRYDASLGG